MPSSRRLQRLAEELEEGGLDLAGAPAGELLLEEIDHALRPVIHERRVPSVGAIIDPTTAPATWSMGTQLEVTREAVRGQTIADARRFADGLSSWLLRRSTGDHEWIVFDRPAGSERDLVILAKVTGGSIVQRHPAGRVRAAGPFGVMRWNGLTWHHEPPVREWIDLVTAGYDEAEAEVLRALIVFAVHDLGAAGIGALLIHRSGPDPGPPVEERLALPPPLDITRATHLAPIRHVLTQVDGAAVFDNAGLLCRLGVRLVPSGEAERDVEGLGGTRHTSGLRYSYDDPAATVIAVSEDGPVTVLRNGNVLGRSPL